MKRLLAVFLAGILLLASGCGYRISITKEEDETTESATVAETTTEETTVPETTAEPTTAEETTISPLTENGIVYESENYRPMAMDSRHILQLYTEVVNNVKLRCPGFKKRDDQNFSDVQTGSGDFQVANRILNLVATEVLKSAAGESDVSTIPAHDDLKVLNNFPIYGQEYACALTELSMLKSAACYTDGERCKIVLTVQDTSNAEPVTSEFGKIMTPVRREEIADRITRYFVMLDEEKFKFDFRYTGNEIICVFNKETKELEYLSQRMIVNIDINLDMDLVIFSTDFVRATGKVISHIEYTDFDWSAEGESGTAAEARTTAPPASARAAGSAAAETATKKPSN